MLLCDLYTKVLLSHIIVAPHSSVALCLWAVQKKITVKTAYTSSYSYLCRFNLYFIHIECQKHFNSTAMQQVWSLVSGQCNNSTFDCSKKERKVNLTSRHVRPRLSTQIYVPLCMYDLVTYCMPII